MSNNNPIDAQNSLIYIDSGAFDPSTIATGGTKGTLFIQPQGVGAPQLFQKQDEGVTTNWTLVGTGGGGGTPSLPVQSVQFNNAGAFGGSADFIFDFTNIFLGLGQATPQTKVHFTSIATTGTVGVDAIFLGLIDGGGNYGDGCFVANGFNGANFSEGSDSAAFGTGNDSQGPQSFSAGNGNTVAGTNAAAFGDSNNAAGQISFVANIGNIARGDRSAVFGTSNQTDSLALGFGVNAFVFGFNCIANGLASHAGGYQVQALGDYSHAEGQSSSPGVLGIASGEASHSEGFNTIASGLRSHAEGNATRATGLYAHSEGESGTPGTNGIATGQASHSEGKNAIASGIYSHAENFQCTASGTASHAEGGTTVSSALGSHAEGIFTLASHDGSHAAGLNTKTGRVSQTVIGEWNLGAADTLFEIGNGTGLGTEATAFAVSAAGEALLQKEVYLPDTTQSLGAAFTIAYNKTYTKIDSAGDVTSSAVTAIAAGTREGQIILLDNRGAFNITLKNAAGTELPGGIDYTVGPKGTIEFIWTGANWRCKGSSSN